MQDAKACAQIVANKPTMKYGIRVNFFILHKDVQREEEAVTKVIYQNNNTIPGTILPNHELIYVYIYIISLASFLSDLLRIIYKCTHQKQWKRGIDYVVFLYAHP
jgi:hypothetical protein